MEERGALAEPLLDDENADIPSFMVRSPHILGEDVEVVESLNERATIVFNQSFFPIIGMLC